MSDRCHKCNVWMTLEEVDKNYNEFKIPYCGDCIKEVRNENEKDTWQESRKVMTE